jgi:hypothetical protein
LPFAIVDERLPPEWMRRWCPRDKEFAMTRTVKSRSRKPRVSDPHARALRGVNVEKLRRYLAFVRAVVGVSTKSVAR